MDEYTSKRFAELKKMVKFFEKENIPRNEFFKLYAKSQLVKEGKAKWDDFERFKNDMKFPKIIWNESFRHLKNFLEHLWDDDIIEEIIPKEIMLQNFKPLDKEGDRFIDSTNFSSIKCFNTEKLFVIIWILMEFKVLHWELSIYDLMIIHFVDKNGNAIKRNTLVDYKSRNKNSNLKKDLEEKIAKWLIVPL